MKKKYGLESIIGKKSKLRFPRLLYLNKVELLTFVLPANSAIAQPPLSTSITFKKGEHLNFVISLMKQVGIKVMKKVYLLMLSYIYLA
jgi:hypothetical protein